MSKKLTIEFVREQFEKESYILESKVYINCEQKLDYTCPEGHSGSICWASWQQGHRCLECFGLKKLTIGFVKDQFEKEGYTLLSEKYINNKTPLDYTCPEGHPGTIIWNSWQSGQRCLECSGNKKLTYEFVKSEFEKGDYTLLTKEYTGAFQDLDYTCPEGHPGSICWNNWRQGQRCKICYLENNKGENHPRYNPNLTGEDRQARRHILGYEEWTFSIKERDDFTCQACRDNKGGNLISHHLESYTVNPDLRTALDKGVCLCEKCHKNFHHKYGYGNNTKEQFSEFLCAQKILLETLGDV